MDKGGRMGKDIREEHTTQSTGETNCTDGVENKLILLSYSPKIRVGVIQLAMVKE